MKLFLKVALFTVVMPGTFAGLLPFLIVRDSAIAGGATLASSHSNRKADMTASETHSARAAES